MAKGLPYNTPTANSKPQLQTLHFNYGHYNPTADTADITPQLWTLTIFLVIQDHKFNGPS